MWLHVRSQDTGSVCLSTRFFQHNFVSCLFLLPWWHLCNRAAWLLCNRPVLQSLCMQSVMNSCWKDDLPVSRPFVQNMSLGEGVNYLSSKCVIFPPRAGHQDLSDVQYLIPNFAFRRWIFKALFLVSVTHNVKALLKGWMQPENLWPKSEETYSRCTKYGGRSFPWSRENEVVSGLLHNSRQDGRRGEGWIRDLNSEGGYRAVEFACRHL